jgi:hypothetical protein
MNYYHREQMSKKNVLAILKDHIEEIHSFKIQQLSVFGSVARDQDSPKSDVDILVRFIGSPTFDRYMDLKFFLEDLLGRKVDLVTEDALRAEIKEHIKKDLVRVA